MENKDLQPAPVALTASMPAKQAPQGIARVNPKDHFRTDGEKKFDRLTYSTIGYVLNALLSVVAVYAVERTPGGQRHMDSAIEWTQKKFKRMNPDTAKMIATKSFFLTGGFAVMAPMKWLEDAKVPLVKKWDRKIYGDAVDTDPNIIRSHQELEAAPKQSWASILGSRVLALIPFYVLVGVLWDNKSSLSRMTNENLQNVYKDAGKTFLEANPKHQQNVLERILDKDHALRNADHGFFSRLMNSPLREARSKALDTYIKTAPHDAAKGIYFDHPITAASRYIGKKIAQLQGKDTIIKEIEHVEKEFPGMMTHPKFKESPTARDHDPNHTALPYYFISEAITSGVVAWGVYVLTRVLGPIVGKKQTPVAAVETPKLPPATIATLPVQKDVALPEQAADHPLAQKKEQPEAPEPHHAKPHHTPHTKVHTAAMEHHGAHENTHHAQSV